MNATRSLAFDVYPKSETLEIKESLHEPAISVLSNWGVGVRGGTLLLILQNANRFWYKLFSLPMSQKRELCAKAVSTQYGFPQVTHILTSVTLVSFPGLAPNQASSSQLGRGHGSFPVISHQIF